jgi:hypothetical protein
MLYCLFRIERVLVLHDTKRGDAPIDRVHPEMGRHVVGQVILVLRPTWSAVVVAGDCGFP